MASDWTENGPISLPPRSLAYGAGAIIALLAVIGLGLGLKAAWRQPAAPGFGAEASGNAGDDAVAAQPIVELPPPVTAPAPAKDEAKPAAPTDEDKAKALAAQTAAAQAVQAKPSKPAADIDDILTSASEKPPAPAKPPTDEAPPDEPAKSDVPF